MAFLGRALRSPITAWIVLVAAALGAVAWFYIRTPAADASYHATKRWKSLVGIEASNQFRSLTSPTTTSGGADPGPEEIPASVQHIDWSKPHVSVYSVPTLTPPRPRPTLRDLADNGQAHAIDFLARSTNGASNSWASLQQALIDASEAEGGKDPLRFDRVLVATVSKGTSWHPGDRMVWTRIFVQPINFTFAGYTVASTENATIKVSSVEATSTRKFSANIGLTLPGVEGPKADIGPSIEHTVKDTADVNAQYEKLGIDIKPGFLRIVRESETGGDVVGNTTVALSVLTDPHLIWTRTAKGESSAETPDSAFVLLVTDARLYDGATDVAPKQATMTVVPQAQLPHCALLADVSMLHEWREIVEGFELYEESQQAVVLHQDADVNEHVEIVPADDVSPAVWSIQILPAHPDEAGPPQFLKAHVGAGDPDNERELVFTDHDLASRLAHWVRTHAGMDIQGLHFNYKAGDSVQPVKMIHDECDGKHDRVGAKATYRRHPD